MDRKDLLLRSVEIPKRLELLDESKLRIEVDEAAALTALKEMRGWKLLYSKFIEPRKSIERIFTAKGPFKRAEAIAAVQELDLLIRFVEGHIEDGMKANEKLESIRTK